MSSDELPPPTPAELTSEKNLWQVYVRSRSIEKKAGVQWARSIGAFVLGFYSGYSVATQHPVTTSVAETVRGLASEGLSFSSQIIGFVLAGFTIFASQTSSTFLDRMASLRERVSKHSYLKYVYMSFMRVFMFYVAFMSLCLAIRTIGGADGLVDIILTWFERWDSAGHVRSFVARGAFLTLALSFWLIVVELYSLSFNVYHTVMSGVRWNLENPERTTNVPKRKSLGESSPMAKRRKRASSNQRAVDPE